MDDFNWGKGKFSAHLFLSLQALARRRPKRRRRAEKKGNPRFGPGRLKSSGPFGLAKHRCWAQSTTKARNSANRRPRSERTTPRESLTMRTVEPSPGGWSGHKGESAWSRPVKGNCCYSESSKVRRLGSRPSTRISASGAVSGERESAQSRASVLIAVEQG